MGVIYTITCTISNKNYIGGTNCKNPLKRWNQHKNSPNKKGGCSALKKAIKKKYGIDNFKWKILYFCFNEDTWKYEVLEILKYNTILPDGYNISKGGKATYGFLGKTHTLHQEN